MRVLLIANTLPPQDISGVGEQVLQLAAGLRAEGHEVQVLGRGRGQAAGPKLLFPLTVVPACLRALARFRPHVVQVHESDGALAALATATVAALARPRPLLTALLQVSYVEERRAVRPLRWRGRILGRPGPVERRFRWLKAPLQIVLGWATAELADIVLAPSRRTADEIERDYRVSGVRVLPNVTGGLVRDAGPETPGESAGPLLFVGRLRLRKGVEVLLEALAAGGAAAEARLEVVGDGEHRAFLERRTRELGLADRVRFRGRCGPERVRSLLAGARALVVPSVYEGMPLVILEAMEAAVPVVASAVSGIPEVVVDGETGWLVPPEDPAALERAVGEAWSQPLEARRRGLAGRARLEERFRPRHAARQWLDTVRPAAPREEGDG
ncbi:MAG: glycosyltransferase family 4 protein [Thermoanaerobaculia bacterium]|nr:glycosyltransferase family 4 protein [Thermoanaerobaculia bacterium]